MWYAIDAADESIIWESENKEYTRQWTTPENVFNIVFRAFKDGKNTHVEYIFSYQ